MRDKYLKYLLLAPGVLVIFLVALWPIFQSLTNSFTEWKLSSLTGPVWLWTLEDGWGELVFLFDNFLFGFEDPLALNAAYATLVFTVFSVAFTIVFAMGLALMLFKGGFTRSFVRSILLLPFAMSPALVGVSWRFMVNADYGVFHAIGAFLVERMNFDWLGDPTMAMIVLIASDVWHWTPYMTLLLIGALSSVPKEILEAAHIDGAGGVRTFFDITLPVILPSVGVATILKTIFSLKMFDQVYMLTDGGPNHATQTLGHYIYVQGFKYFNMGYASALSYWLIVPLAFLAYGYIKIIFPKAKP